MKDLVGEEGDNHTKELASKVRAMVAKVLVNKDDVTSTAVREGDTASTRVEDTGDGENVSAIVIDENEIATTIDTNHTFPNLNADDDIELKKEEVEEEVKNYFSQRLRIAS